MPVARLFSILLVGLAGSLSAAAESWRSEVEVTMFAVPETVWQKRFEAQFDEHPALWLRLNADAAAGLVAMPMDFKFRLVNGEAVVQRKGLEEEFVESWQVWRGMDTPAVPDEKTKRFIGTTVELAQKNAAEGEPLRVQLGLEHHIAPPGKKRFNYANAATGAERDRMSVEYPQFETMEWRGELTVWREWRLVTNVLHLPVIPSKTPMPATRYLVFIKRA